jgi:hypothetical protein
MLGRASLCNGWMRGLAIVVAAATSGLVLAARAETPGLQNAPGGPGGGVSGKVARDNGQPVAGAVVVLCEQAGGVPLAEKTLQPFVRNRTQSIEDDILFSRTDANGRFAFEKIPVGSYRLVAQSWRNATSIRAVMEINGDEIELHGIANDVRVAAGATSDVVLRPLGTGVLRMDQRVPNNETFVILSTAPTGADPVLRFAGWTPSFLQHVIGGNRMPVGKTVVHGLPEGTVHVAMFAMDNRPGFLDAKVQIQGGQTTVLPFTPFVAAWSDGRHDPPPELTPVFEEVGTLQGREWSAWLTKAFSEASLHTRENDGRPEWFDRLGAEVVLPSGRRATAGQVMAVFAYRQLQDRAKETTRRGPARGSAPPEPIPPKPAIPPSELQRLIDEAQPGATVTVPKGTHTVPVRIAKPVTLKGSSPEDCILEVTANGPALFLDAGGKGEVSIEGLTIKWQLATSDKSIERPVALAVKDTNASIRTCRFIPLGNTQRSPMAIRIDGVSKATVGDCRFEGFDFVINYGPGTEGLVEGCILRDGGHQGVTGYDRSTLRVERTIVAGFKYHGLRCTGGTLHAQGNVLMDNKVSGVYLGNKDGQGTLTNNLMIRNGEGVAGFYQARFEIRNNVVLDSTGAGIGVWDSCRLNISDNIFQGNAKALVVYPKGSKDTNTIGANAFWRNTADTENCRRADDSILVDPLFQDPSAGDYSLKAGPCLDRKQGLTNPQTIHKLLERWKNEAKSPVKP